MQMAPTHTIPFIFIGVMFVLALLVIGGIVLIAIKGGKIGRRILAGIGIGIVLLFLAFFYFRAGLEVNLPQVHVQSLQNISELSHITPSIWMPGMESEFTASSYASPLSAAQALARQVEPLIAQLQPQDITLTGNTDQTILETVAEAIRSNASQPRQVQLTNVPDTTAYLNEHENAMIVSIHVTEEGSIAISGPLPFAVPHGSVQLTVQTRDTQRSLSAGYFNRSWVENFSEFVNRTPNINWILARSQTSCTSEAQARQEALQDALQQLQGRYLVEVGGKGPVTLTESDITSGNFIVDRFTQSLAGSATPIWREAILIDASPAKIVQAANKITTVTSQTHKSWAGKGLSLLGMLALICLVYGFLNLATRGYYIWALRILAVVLLAAGILALWTFS